MLLSIVYSQAQPMHQNHYNHQNHFINQNQHALHQQQYFQVPEISNSNFQMQPMKQNSQVIYTLHKYFNHFVLFNRLFDAFQHHHHQQHQQQHQHNQQLQQRMAQMNLSQGNKSPGYF